MQVPDYLLQKIRCPHCAKIDSRGPDGSPGLLRLERECWLICGSCERKYPAPDGVPVLTIQEGEKWIGTPSGELPVPPPSDNQSAYDRK